MILLLAIAMDFQKPVKAIVQTGIVLIQTSILPTNMTKVYLYICISAMITHDRHSLAWIWVTGYWPIYKTSVPCVETIAYHQASCKSGW